MMTRTLIATILTSALCMTPITTTTLDQVPTKDETCPKIFVLTMENGAISFESFIELYSKLTNQRVFWDARRIQHKKISGTGTMKFEIKDAERVFQNILFMNDLVAIKTGDPDLRMVKICDIRTSVSLKAEAKFLSIEDLMGSYHANDVVTVVVPVKNVQPQIASRALSMLIQDHRSSSVTSIDTSNLVIITNFASRAKMLVRLIQDIDAKAVFPIQNKTADAQDSKK